MTNPGPGWFERQILTVLELRGGWEALVACGSLIGFFLGMAIAGGLVWLIRWSVGP